MANIPLALLKDRLRSQKREREPSLGEMRASLDSVSARVRLDPRILLETATMGGRPAEWLKPKAADPKAAILYLHGGGFVAGSCASHRPLAAEIALASGMNTVVIDYRLAPEHPWPAAEMDALAAYDDLLRSDVAAIYVIGDSAGGNLAVGALLRAGQKGMAMPKACGLMSPWIDLSLSGTSMETLAASDPTLTRDALARYAALYRGAAARGGDFLASDLSGFPPPH